MNKYYASEMFLDRAIKSIPLGSQTFSKSYLHYPKGASPFFIKKAKGGTCWDIDNNEYLDMVNALAAVTLGYQDVDVDTAVIDQIKNGTIFSLPGCEETYLAETLIDLIPSAEQVRFGKNASDATSAAVRIARAATGKDKIAVCGYHGWHDWYIATTPKNLGIPSIISTLTNTFQYNNIESLHTLLKKDPDNYAAVIMEPMNVEFPEDDFLFKVQELCKTYGALLIFDETVTGFRIHNQGAQGLFNIKPDLSCFGKGLANGYPISAIVGKEEYMSLLDKVFFSFTYGGDLIGISAAQAAIKKILSKDVVQHNSLLGHKIKTSTEALILVNKLDGIISISGHDAWSFINFNISDEVLLYEIRTLFMQEILSRGILSLGTHNLSFAHTRNDIDKLVDAYGEIFPLIKIAYEKGSAKEFLKCETLRPLFQVRKR